MNELPREMESAVRALDARAAQAAGRVDAERVARRVMERLRREGALEPRHVWFLRPAALRIAAAAVVLVAAGATVARLTHRAPDAAAIRLPVTLPMDSLSTSQLEAVLRAAGEVRPANNLPVTTSNQSLDNLSEQELQKLLASLNGEG